MEKKKLLLVAVSVGVVLLIIIGIPLMMIVPRQHYATTADVNRDWVMTVEPTTVQSYQPSVEPIVEPQTFTYNAQPNENAFFQPEQSPHITTLTIPIPETVAVPSTPVVQAQKPSTVKLAPASKPAPVAAQPAAPAAKPAPKPVAVAAKKPATDTKTYSNYWVQTGAFSTKIRAEGARESLESKGIASIIDNRDIDGKTWYRVRVGPYTSETEANYWLALVKAIDGFGESQIRLSQAVQ
ncbi:MAG: SPOR domain-containing protein [Treponema sp.]|jgi:DedD protein|nr:SPOR domain-containing protein [Treponema sp.]